MVKEVVKMSTITKEKNIIKIYIEDNKKPYIIDMSDGSFYGLSGRPIQTLPSTVGKVINNYPEQTNVIKFLKAVKKEGCCNEFSKKLSEFLYCLKIWDRLDSIGYRHIRTENMLNIELLETINKNFKSFVRSLKEEPLLKAEEFYFKIKKDEWCIKYGIKNGDFLFTDTMFYTLSRTGFNEKQIKYTLYQLRNGLGDFFETSQEYYLISYLERYFEYCDYIGMEYEYEKQNFIKAYNTAKKNYFLRKTEIDNAKLSENQLNKEKALYFSYGNLETIIPITSDEFFKEGQTQSNCVAKVCLPKVVQGKTNIVFIRRKNDIKFSYITCEVRNGKIIQYLGKYNSTIVDEEALRFKELYQEHLLKNW